MTRTLESAAALPDVGAFERLKAMLAIFSERSYDGYLALQLVSITGSMLQTLIQAWIVQIMTNSSLQVSLIWAYGLIPGALFAPFLGPMVNKYDKRRILQITSALALVQSLILGGLVLYHMQTVWEMDCLALILGMINAVDANARNSIIPGTIRNRSHIRYASIVFTSLYTFGQVGGPMIAVPFAKLFPNYGWLFIVNGLTFLPLIFGLRFIRLNPIEEKTEHTVRDAAHLTFSNPKLKACTIYSGLVTMFGYSYMAILSPASTSMFEAGTRMNVYAYLNRANGLGSFVGSIAILLIIIISPRMPFRLLLTGGSILTGSMLVLFSMTGNVHTAEILLFFAGAGFMMSFSCLRSTILHLAGQKMAGTVMGFTISFFFGGAVIGFFSAGYFAKFFGCPAVFAVEGIALIITGVIALSLHPETGN